MELREWQYISKPAGNIASNSSSSGYKKIFEKLIKYHIDHASSELESITKKDIEDESFVLREHYNTGSEEFDRDIIVNWDKNTNTFYFSMYINGKHKEANNRIGWEQFLKLLDCYMFLPDQGSSEWNDLLIESLNEWQLVNPPTSASAPSSTGSFESYKERFKKLFNYATKHKRSSVDQTAIEKLSEDEHMSMFHFTHHILGGAQRFDYDLEIILAINKPRGNWYLHVYEFDGKTHNKIADLRGPDYETLLKTLSDYIEVPAVGSAEYKDMLQESINTSIADDFKLYENLWD